MFREDKSIQKMPKVQQTWEVYLLNTSALLKNLSLSKTIVDRLCRTIG